MIDPHALPVGFAAHIRERAGVEPVEPRAAATTVLVRGGRPGVPGSLEVFLQRRPASMAFAPDMLVFPGGGVDASDALALAALPPDWAQWLGCTADEAAAIVCAAARELFEEAGVLLAGGAGRADLQELSDPAWESDRRALETRRTSMGEFLLDRDLVLRSDLLAPWRIWTTPVFEPKRFRAHFLIAEAPAGQAPRNASGESVSGGWVTVADALRGAGKAHAMLPPQILMCAELFEFDSAAAAVQAGWQRRRPEVQPHLGGDADNPRLEFGSELDRVWDEVSPAIQSE
ncbi:NUDIX domain-containing protein [Brevibacterium sp. 91QC2O2]|uniref:NUDIX domain-containing protein n=1 Tax=Brevibacterium sp. 91QC2O2 TaxID=2968458 RepID=UPI00211CD1BC|nr:NUDIX domain-containing protein [Brevibacterium sp. 91QC2O2]MCQ9367170.1 NUDIX domain-containing protein [Brevibacterium sp. 91QC2O2]